MRWDDRKDLAGFRSGTLVAIEPIRSDPRLGIIWLCRCDCGASREVASGSLRQKTTNRCKRFCSAADIFEVKSGDQFGTRTVIKQEDNTKTGQRRFSWKCDCGATGVSALQNLKTTQGCRSCSQLLRNGRKSGDASGFLSKLYTETARRAQKYSRDFTLSLEEFSILSLSNCVYCGLEPSNIIKKRGLELKYSGLDRVDNLNGYTQKNSVSCCYPCNRAKSNMKEKDWEDWLIRIVNFRSGVQ